MTYDLNALGQRIRKRGPASITNSSLATVFVYNEAGQLLGEYDANRNPINEYVYANGELVAIFKGAASASNLIGQVYTDHLGSPRAVVRQATPSQAAALLWQWESDPFGSNLPNENPQNQGSFSLNLRFPGQYYDRESNTHYNYFRDYDPKRGGYIQSDPIGLNGGQFSTYAYVNGGPLQFIDPFGLATAEGPEGPYSTDPKAHFPLPSNEGGPRNNSHKYLCDDYEGIKNKICTWCVKRACNFSGGASAFCCLAEHRECVANAMQKGGKPDDVAQCNAKLAGCGASSGGSK